MPVICSPVFPADQEECMAPHFADFAGVSNLSDFQKHAIKSIVDGNHVLVCAPTGSGKTLPAEFAIRHFTSQGTSAQGTRKRVIYTSPIKALSNQKYHDFTRKFPNISVGLCTGDIKTNPTADLLIMTAEILNNRLFLLDKNKNKNKNADECENNLSFQMDLETELAAVIMDEVHYINDENRGHVWEQTIMLLPPQVQMIMLSATLDGPERFAKWIEDTRPKWIEDCQENRQPKWIEDCQENRQPDILDSILPTKKVCLASTSIRIVPLSHYAFFPKAPESLLKATKSTPLEQVVKQYTGKLIALQTFTNVFQPTGYKAIEQLTELWRDKMPGQVSRKHVLNSLATFMKGLEDPDFDDCMLPAIVFMFSRKQVEESAQNLTANILPFDSKIPYNAAHECEQIIRRLPNWREYAELPEYKSLVRLLEKGVGIHHSGMIPVLREIVELMISQKKIYMLFATESFAIGLDCPIRTAVMTGLTKFDGSQDRFLYAHEYTQMAGRAGRRGIDKVGHVIHLPLLFRREIPSESAYRDILSNRPQTLVSKFHIDYKMVLSLLKKGIRSDFHLFAEKSMSKNRIDKEAESCGEELRNLRAILDDKTAAAKHLRTPQEACAEYERLRVLLPNTVNKKRKELERKMTVLQDQHKYIVSDVDCLAGVGNLRRVISDTEEDLAAMETYLKTQTVGVCRILLERGVIRPSEYDEYELVDPLGIIAANLAETHPIPLAELAIKTGWFRAFDSRQLVGIFSAFVDVRLNEQERYAEPKCDDPAVLDAIHILRDSYSDVHLTELSYRLNTGIVYDGALCFDMADLMMEWCDLAEESECRRFLETCSAIGLSAGDFSKACLKLSALTKELSAVCELFPYKTAVLEFAHKLAAVDGLILKHIATIQSLYL